MRTMLMKMLSKGNPEAESAASLEEAVEKITQLRSINHSKDEEITRLRTENEKKNAEIEMLKMQIDMYAATQEVYMRKQRADAITESVRAGKAQNSLGGYDG